MGFEKNIVLIEKIYHMLLTNVLEDKRLLKFNEEQLKEYIKTIKTITRTMKNRVLKKLRRIKNNNVSPANVKPEIKNVIEYPKILFWVNEEINRYSYLRDEVIDEKKKYEYSKLLLILVDFKLQITKLKLGFRGNQE